MILKKKEINFKLKFFISALEIARKFVLNVFITYVHLKYMYIIFSIVTVKAFCEAGLRGSQIEIRTALWHQHAIGGSLSRLVGRVDELLAGVLQKLLL